MPAEESPRSLPPCPTVYPTPPSDFMCEFGSRMSGGLGGGEGRRMSVHKRCCAIKVQKCVFRSSQCPAPGAAAPAGCRPQKPPCQFLLLCSFIISAAVCTVARSGRRLAASAPWLGFIPFFQPAFTRFFEFAIARGAFLCVAWILN